MLFEKKQQQKKPQLKPIFNMWKKRNVVQEVRTYLFHDFMIEQKTRASLHLHWLNKYDGDVVLEKRSHFPIARASTQTEQKARALITVFI